MDCRLASLNLEDESEINWKALSESDLNIWSAHILQRHWTKLKKSVKGHEDRTFSGKVLRLCPRLFSRSLPTETLKMVKVKNEAKLSGGKKTAHHASKNGTQGEDKKALTMSKVIVEDSDTGLAPLDD
jgi:hypothetical protein